MGIVKIEAFVGWSTNNKRVNHHSTIGLCMEFSALVVKCPQFVWCATVECRGCCLAHRLFRFIYALRPKTQQLHRLLHISIYTINYQPTKKNKEEKLRNKRKLIRICVFVCIASCMSLSAYWSIFHVTWICCVQTHTHKRTQTHRHTVSKVKHGKMENLYVWRALGQGVTWNIREKRATHSERCDTIWVGKAPYNIVQYLFVCITYTL